MKNEAANRLSTNADYISTTMNARSLVGNRTGKFVRQPERLPTNTMVPL